MNQQCGTMNFHQKFQIEMHQLRFTNGSPRHNQADDSSCTTEQIEEKNGIEESGGSHQKHCGAVERRRRRHFWLEKLKKWDFQWKKVIFREKQYFPTENA